MHIPVGIKSLAVSFPSVIRTNDYFKENYPDLVAKSEEMGLARAFSLAYATPSNEFELAMQPYSQDPFRGTVERRVLGTGESSLTLEYKAAIDTLNAAKLSIEDVDLLIVSSFLPNQIGFGNAAFLARELGLKCGAWNLDVHAASAPIALETASALVQAGVYRNVLVVISCTYSRLTDENDTLSWFFGDGAGAFLVSSLEMNQGILSSKIINTGVLCDQFPIEIKTDEYNNPQLRMQVSEGANKIMSETATEHLRTCCDGAVEKAGISWDEIDFFVSCTPMAWFSDFCVRVLNINPERTINLYPYYANIGPVLSINNLYHAAKMGKIRENDLILMYAVGASSSASACVMRWGNVALG
ncbi:3-oxoacyl-[acyl-carrier-protein] synthase III [Calothrix sp. NIES-4101]|nr:3-oxoacyl-[acyl-carrier-protein] synthase III [Calothrix sp. NIES-4101]